MKKIWLMFALLVSAMPALFAQTRFETSEGFEEPDWAYNKILQLTNGNTFYFHFLAKEGIQVKVYDKNRKLISEKLVTSTLWDPKKISVTAVEGLYEIGGQPVIFLHQMDGRKPLLYRLKLDAQTGAPDGEKLICKLPAYKAGSGWAMTYGGVESMDFYVEKDPYSDCYAVVNFNSFAKESDERIEVVHYNAAGGTHKIVSRSYYDVPDDRFKYVRYVAMAVREKEVYICTYGFNGKWSAKDAKIIVSKLSASDKQFTHNQLEYTEDFRDTKGMMLYNPGTNMLQLMSLTEMKSKGKMNYYLPLLHYIDPESLSIVSTKVLQASGVSKDLVRQQPKADGFHGLPQNMILNKDYSTTVLMEEQAVQVTLNSAGQVVSAVTALGNIGISELNSRGLEEDGHALLKSQVMAGMLGKLYQANKQKGIWSSRKTGVLTGVFMSFDYVNTENGRYVLFNDHPENIENTGSAKRKKVVAISGTSTVCYRMKSGTPDQFYLFGKPADKQESRFCYIESSNYLPATNTFATLLVQREGRKKEAKIAWVHFD